MPLRLVPMRFWLLTGLKNLLIPAHEDGEIDLVELVRLFMCVRSY